MVRFGVRGAAIVLVLAAVAIVVAMLAFRGRERDESPPSAIAASAPSSAEDSRALGFRLLTLSDPGEVRAGVGSLTKAAERGDVEAEVALGRIYLQGNPAVLKDALRAHYWFARAEVAHHPSAAYFLGVMSQSGEGTKADPAAADHWFEIAAHEGSPQAMFMLANAYRVGAGAPKNDAKAIELYERAGELEHPAALQALAMAYLHGELGLEPDESEFRRYSMEAEHAIKHPPPPP